MSSRRDSDALRARAPQRRTGNDQSRYRVCSLRGTADPRDRQRHERPGRTGRRRSDGLHTGRAGLRCQSPEHHRRLLTRERLPLVRGARPGVPQDGAPHTRCLFTAQQGGRRKPDRAERHLRFRRHTPGLTADVRHMGLGADSLPAGAERGAATVPAYAATRIRNRLLSGSRRRGCGRAVFVSGGRDREATRNVRPGGTNNPQPR